ncbi:DDE-type integrase/transposase/recombinase, partial [Paraferrimonas sp. SM1919]|uniref:DDE-type integrase/transposase/recombinase n=1 Tax=Paraferrimonas sp. SM1919 TaxID=2662263 RepID=UPI0013D3A7D7
MPWNEVSTVTLRKEFIALAKQQGANISQLCRRFHISRKTAYKWLKRDSEGYSLENRSTRPHHSPYKTDNGIEALIMQARIAHPEWSGRKLKRFLENLGYTDLPTPSTITKILQRNNLIKTSSASTQTNWIRFEHPNPNDLWQMDYKGPIHTASGKGFALTILDDHSRYSLGVEIATDMTFESTKAKLSMVFERYGLPCRMTMDNGVPWGNNYTRWSRFTLWLLDQDIKVSHSRPYHPQTQGKD